MNAAAPDVSLIICAYTEARWKDLVEAVSSVERQTLSPSEVLVVIDHNPALLERASRELQQVTVTENREARGLSGARNSGIRLARGSIIAFLDEDAIASPDWLENLVRGYEGPQVLGVGGAIQPIWNQVKPDWLPQEFYWVVGCTYRGLPPTPAPVRNLIGCNMSMRREVFESVGGFRDGIGRIGLNPLGCEETELCIRANQYWANGYFMFQPLACVYHHVPPARTSWRYFISRCYAEGLSKALVSQYVGSRDGLSTERSYVLKTLPRAVARNLLDGLRTANLAGFLRSAAILAGFTVTALGYLRGLQSRPRVKPPTSRKPLPAALPGHDK
jgi:glucosyl-dolichyl phosphate glucuronosyltransferase